eukprot:COSAG01_NODE_314_length_19013_cov_164.111240_18_plen_99_part_00
MCVASSQSLPPDDLFSRWYLGSTALVVSKPLASFRNSQVHDSILQRSRRLLCRRRRPPPLLLLVLLLLLLLPAERRPEDAAGGPPTGALLQPYRFVTP